jgi:hypothetical protein
MGKFTDMKSASRIVLVTGGDDHVEQSHLVGSSDLFNSLEDM